MLEIELFQMIDGCYCVIVWCDEDIQHKHTIVDYETAHGCFLHYSKLYPLARKIRLVEHDQID